MHLQVNTSSHSLGVVAPGFSLEQNIRVRMAVTDSVNSLVFFMLLVVF